MASAVPQDEIVGMTLRQSAAKNIEAFTTVGGAGDHERAISRRCGIRP